MRKIIYFLIGICSLLQSCKSGKNNDGPNTKKKDVPFLLHMNAVFTDAERNVSFPTWFNDSLIAANNISKITRSFYLIEEEESEEKWELTSEMPREKREYWFSPSGQIKQMDVSYFYDNQIIGMVTFKYNDYKDEYGFVSVTRVGENDSQWETEEDNLSSYFNIHQKGNATSKYLSYQNDQTGDYLFFMLDKKYWGPLSVDSILRPTPKDIVVLGNPSYPNKIYRVQNKVNEMDVQQFVYGPSGKKIETITRHEYPFEHKRTILYSKKGICDAYIDSTFSDKKYLTRVLSEIEINDKNLPLKVTHKKENQLNNKSRISIELLSYE